MSWQLAPALAAARDEANRIAPRRSKAADGTIGDAAHAASTSDHNPTAAGWVNALDLTHDPGGGFDAHHWADIIAARNDPRVKYLISRGRIWNPTLGDRPGAWRMYSGSNPHNSHMHISVRDTDAARSNTTPWFGAAAPTPPPQEVPDMLPDERQALFEVLANSKSTNQAVGAIHVSVNDPTSGVRTMVAQLLARQPAGADPAAVAKAVADALPDDLARLVADELAERLKD